MTTEEYNKNYSTKSSLDNTLTSPTKKEEVKPKVKKVIKGTATTKKKSLKDKFLDTFVTEDMATVKENIISNVIMGLKSFALDSLEMIMFGEYSSRRSRLSSGINRNYNAISTRSRSSLERPIQRPQARDSRAQSLDDILLETRGDAEIVLDTLAETIEQYGQVTIADLLESVGRSKDIEYTDYKYGWQDISGAQIIKVRGEGYLLKMPRPTLVD